MIFQFRLANLVVNLGNFMAKAALVVALDMY